MNNSENLLKGIVKEDRISIIVTNLLNETLALAEKVVRRYVHSKILSIKPKINA